MPPLTVSRGKKSQKRAIFYVSSSGEGEEKKNKQDRKESRPI
jgi:hypothetical protein